MPLPFEDQNGIITGYVVQYWSERSGNVSVEVDSTSYTVSAVPFARYWVRVAAENSAGQGPYSDVVIAKTLPDGKIN